MLIFSTDKFPAKVAPKAISPLVDNLICGLVSMFELLEFDITLLQSKWKS